MLEEIPAQTRGYPTLHGGRYVISGVLGKGGNARVYQAWDTTLRAWRAIKVLSPQFLDDETVRSRFALEAATMARLDHPHLVKVYDISDDPYTPHIVMELCEGGAVIDWMKVHGAVPPQMAIKVIGQIAQAVHAAHEENIIHRDIKPQNILIDQYGMAKLTDFGIARDQDSGLTMAGATIGTYAFMAPEQRHDSTSVDIRTDIYSLGATLFTLVRVKTTTELFVAEPDDPLFDGLPEALVQFILRTCSYRPKDRYQTVDAFIDGLLEISGVLPADPPTTPPIQDLAAALPARPPDDLPDLAQLEDLLKALALNGGQPHTTGGSTLDATTLGGRPDPFAVLRDYAQPDLQEAPAPAPDPYLEEEATEPAFEEVQEPQNEPAEVEQAIAPVQEALAEVRPASNPVAMAIAAASGLAFLLVAIFGVTAMVGSVDVNGAATDVRRAENDLVVSVLATAPAIATLDQAPALRTLYFQVQDGDPAQAARSARAFAVELERAVGSRTPKGDALLLARNVLNASENVDRADSAWAASAGSVTGSLAVAMGLAESP